MPELQHQGSSRLLTAPPGSTTNSTPATAGLAPPDGGTKLQKPNKNYIEKFAKLIDHTNACNTLTNFKYESNEMTGSGNSVNLLNLLFKICVITSGEFIFGGF